MGRKTFTDDAQFEAESTQRIDPKFLKPGILYGYARCSTDKQDTSTEVQEEQLNTVFPVIHAPLGYTFGGIFVDFGVSGDKKICHRPEARKLLARLEPGDAVLTIKLDRLSRRLDDFAGWLRRWKNRGVRYFSLDMSGGRENICTTEQKCMACILMVMAETERDKIRDRTKERKAYDRKRGICSGKVPFGWKNVGGILVADPAEQAKLDRLVMLRDELRWPWKEIDAEFHRDRCAAAGVRYTGSAHCPHFRHIYNIQFLYKAHKARLAQRASEAPHASA